LLPTAELASSDCERSEQADPTIRLFLATPLRCQANRHPMSVSYAYNRYNKYPRPRVTFALFSATPSPPAALAPPTPSLLASTGVSPYILLRLERSCARRRWVNFRESRKTCRDAPSLIYITCAIDKLIRNARRE
jgi:hypothetical protein